MTTTRQEREARQSRRAIDASELPDLAMLGGLVSHARRQAGLSRRVLAARSGLSASALARIEAGSRRTRVSTLRRLAETLVEANETLGPVPRLLAVFIDFGEAVIAPESPYAARIDRRRLKRMARRTTPREQKRGVMANRSGDEPW